MTEPCFKNVFRPKSQDNTNMETRRQTSTRTAKRDVAKNDQQEETTSRVQDLDEGSAYVVAAEDRVAWRRRIDGPILHEEKRARR